jgi:hypothetical protein
MITNSNYTQPKDKSFPSGGQHHKIQSRSKSLAGNTKDAFKMNLTKESSDKHRNTSQQKYKKVAFESAIFPEFKRVKFSPIFHALVELSADGDQA